MFAAGGDLYFSSARPDPETPEADPVNALWMLPADGGEARVVLTRAGGVSGLLAAKDTGALFVNASVLAGSTDEDSDEDRRKARKDNKVAAILHSGYPVRYWDADLGPAQPRLFAVEPGEEQEPGRPATVDAAPPLKLRNLTPDAGSALRDADAVVSPGRQNDLQQLQQAARPREFTLNPDRDRRRHRHPHRPAGYRGNELLPRPGEPGQPDACGPQRERHHAGRGPAGQAAPARRVGRRVRRCAGRRRPDAARPRLGPLAAPCRLAAGRFGRAGHRRRRRRFAGLPDQRDRRRRSRPGDPADRRRRRVHRRRCRPGRPRRVRAAQLL